MDKLNDNKMFVEFFNKEKKALEGMTIEQVMEQYAQLHAQRLQAYARLLACSDKLNEL